MGHRPVEPDPGAATTCQPAASWWNFTIDHFPAVCLCGATRCRGSVTGWKDLTAAQKAGYGDLVAPYLLTMDNEIRLAHSGTASTADSI
jgi:hypothetical protein